MKRRIINILQHPPAYESYRNSPRPEINWDTPDGNWVGIWGYDWSNQLGNEVLRLTDEFEYEVWQPDIRADKVYSHCFENGLVHKLFPAVYENYFSGFRIEKRIVCNALIRAFFFEDIKIVHANSLSAYLNYLIYKNCNVPFLIQVHSKIRHPYYLKKQIRKNLTHNYFYYKVNKLVNNRKCFYVYNNSIIQEDLSCIKSLGYKRLFMGIDFDKFKQKNKVSAKKILNIPDSRRVILMASRFTKGKQIDKIIRILIDLSKKHDFYLLIGGHGDKEYETYLRRLAKPLINLNNAAFLGYLTNTDLLNAYSAADLFISSSLAEGGPVSVMKAFACETPVMCTRVGGVDDIMAEHDVGILVDPFNYEQWKEELIKFFEGKPVKVMDREIAKEHFHWPKIAQKFIEIYRQLSNA